MPEPVAFPEDVVRAVCRHLDEDHAADTLAICRTLGGVSRATAVRAVGVDGSALQLSAQLSGREVAVRVPFAHPVTERAELRAAVVELAQRAARTGAAGG